MKKPNQLRKIWNWIIYEINGRLMKGPDRLYTWTNVWNAQYFDSDSHIWFHNVQNVCVQITCVCERVFGSIFSVQLKLVRALYACFRNNFMARTLLHIYELGKWLFQLNFGFWYARMACCHVLITNIQLCFYTFDVSISYASN